MVGTGIAVGVANGVAVGPGVDVGGAATVLAGTPGVLVFAIDAVDEAGVDPGVAESPEHPPSTSRAVKRTRTPDRLIESIRSTASDARLARSDRFSTAVMLRASRGTGGLAKYIVDTG